MRSPSPQNPRQNLCVLALTHGAPYASLLLAERDQQVDQASFIQGIFQA
jgi:hypothetical protein